MERFWSKVIKTSGCWEWTAASDKYGYGRFQMGTWGHSRLILAHRFSWKESFGDIPEGMFVCHKCDNPKCVKPDHLFLGTAKENTIDCVKKGRHPRNRTKYLPSGTDHHFYEEGPKITREIAIKIRNAPGKQKDIAIFFGVHQSLVSKIKGGHSWK